MIYKENEVPVCPYCDEDICTYVDENTRVGIQNIALSMTGSSTQTECEACYECFIVDNMGGGIYEIN